MIQIILSTATLSILTFILIRYMYIFLISKCKRPIKYKDLFTIYLPLLVAILVTLIVYQYLLLIHLNSYIIPIDIYDEDGTDKALKILFLL